MASESQASVTSHTHVDIDQRNKDVKSICKLSIHATSHGESKTNREHQQASRRRNLHAEEGGHERPVTMMIEILPAVL